jgi:hypothetical protein
MYRISNWNGVGCKAEVYLEDFYFNLDFLSLFFVAVVAPTEICIIGELFEILVSSNDGATC